MATAFNIYENDMTVNGTTVVEEPPIPNSIKAP